VPSDPTHPQSGVIPRQILRTNKFVSNKRKYE
jgi:hypothetical protein